MRSLLFSLAFLVAAVCVPQCAQAQSTTSVTNTYTLCGGGGYMPVDQFDPALGTLLEVKIEAVAEYSFRLEGTPLGSSSGVWTLTADSAYNKGQVDVFLGTDELDSSGWQYFTQTYSLQGRCDGGTVAGPTNTGSGSNGATVFDDDATLDAFTGTSFTMVRAETASVRNVGTNSCDGLDGDMVAYWCLLDLPAWKTWSARVNVTYVYEI